MRIAESSINLASVRHYSARGTRAFSSGGTGFRDKLRDSRAREKEEEKSFDTHGRERNDEREEPDYYGLTVTRPADLRMNGLNMANYFQQSLLSLLFARFHFEGLFGGYYLGGSFGSTTREVVTYEEHETVSFHADGMAKTDDGREINFNVEILMSRSYMEYTSLTVPTVQNALRDPLVINVGSFTADIRDQRFTFDIDSDGSEEEIAMPGKGSGFLALDLNEDGIINDGSELFGTKSGDGFRDLKRYDSDGNGWIDENDSVFDRLKVWCKGDHGEDILMDLRKADIGAIFLGNAGTQFTLNGSDGAMDGVIRSTGLFLRESTGSVGTVQHVDLAVRERDLNRLFEERNL